MFSLNAINLRIRVISDSTKQSFGEMHNFGLEAVNFQLFILPLSLLLESALFLPNESTEMRKINYLGSFTCHRGM